MHTTFKRYFRQEEDFRDCLLERLPKHSVCAEIGVYKGEFSRLVIQRLRPAKYHLIDPWKFFADPAFEKSFYGGSLGGNQEHMDSIFRSVSEQLGRERNVVIHRMGSVEAASLFPDGYFDWVYVDGDHRYEAVKLDLELYLPKLKPGGFLTGDDYGNPGWWEDGVTRAVNEFVAGHTCKTVMMENHQFLLQLA
jgi:hypothetical protein